MHIISFSGNPDASDLTGNTALHLATIHGHIDCVSFLINFGTNLWSLNNDYQTAKDVTVRAHCDSKRAQELLILLDESMARTLTTNPKLVTKQQEKALVDAEKRLKQFKKLQKKSLKKAEKEEKHLEKVRSKMIVVPMNGAHSSRTTVTDQESSCNSFNGSSYYSNSKTTGRLFQTNTSLTRNNFIKSLSNLHVNDEQSLSGQTGNDCIKTSAGSCIINHPSDEDDDGLDEAIDCHSNQSVKDDAGDDEDINVRGIMSEVLKSNRSKSSSSKNVEKFRSKKSDDDQILMVVGSRDCGGNNHDSSIRISQQQPSTIKPTVSGRSKSGSTIQLFESKLAPKTTPKTFSQIVNGDRRTNGQQVTAGNNNYSNGLNYINYKGGRKQSSSGYQSSSSASSSVSSSWKGTISKLNRLTINTSLGAVSKRILNRKASTGSTNSRTSNGSNISTDGIILKQLLIKSGSLNNLSTIYCTSESSKSNGHGSKDKNGFTLNGTASSKSSFSSGNNNDSSLNYISNEFKMIEKINEDSGIGSSVRIRPLTGFRSIQEPDQVLYMNHKTLDPNLNSMYHSMNSLSMRTQPWIEMFQTKTQV